MTAKPIIAYEQALKALAEDKIVVLTPGIGADGDSVVCTSMWEAQGHSMEFLLHPVPSVRASYLLAVASVSREGLYERHGIRCA